jgi:hypothetical protein
LQCAGLVPVRVHDGNNRFAVPCVVQAVERDDRDWIAKKSA